MLDTAQESPTATRMSTAPSRPASANPLRQAWRTLTSMRTALLLLFLLALAAVPGGFLPQQRNNPAKVRDFLLAHPSLGPLLRKASLFDVFGSTWFAAIYLLLFVSLIGCLGPRIRLHARALRTPPPPVPHVLRKLPAHDSWTSTSGSAEVLDEARQVLRRGRWRVVERGGGLSAEKGYLRETGNLVFHVSLVGLLVGVALGSLFGFKGTVLVKQGDGFANTVLSYDDVNPGRRFSPDRLVPFSFTLDQFRATYTPDGKARTFNADITWRPSPDAPTQQRSLEVNHPLDVNGAKTYLIGHGYTVKVAVTDLAGHRLEQSVPCLPQDGNFTSLCTIKEPNARGKDGGANHQLGFEGVFTPDTAKKPDGTLTSTYPAARFPFLTVVGYQGDLGLDSGQTQSVYALDKTHLSQVPGAPVGLQPGQIWPMPGGERLQFLGVSQWATFQVTQDPGKGVALVAGSGMVLGLLLSLFVRRRRVWVRALPAGGPALPAGGPAVPDGRGARTVVEVGGLPRSDLETFQSEFAELDEQLRARTAEVGSSIDDSARPDSAYPDSAINEEAARVPVQ